VLFSPACAAQDQFKDLDERGLAFKAIVAKLMEEMSMGDKMAPIDVAGAA
jgi:hypothetical protein